MIKGLMSGEILSILASSKYIFHLTGSRFFGTNHELSDWDFYAQYCKEVSLFLNQSGFNKVFQYSSFEGGVDENTQEIWRKDGVDVQLVKSAKVKAVSQMIIQDLGICIDKRVKTSNQIRNIWNLVIRFVRTIETL